MAHHQTACFTINQSQCASSTLAHTWKLHKKVDRPVLLGTRSASLLIGKSPPPYCSLEAYHEERPKCIQRWIYFWALWLIHVWWCPFLKKSIIFLYPLFAFFKERQKCLFFFFKGKLEAAPPRGSNQIQKARSQNRCNSNTECQEDNVNLHFVHN